jgi:hypothetical protein
MKCICCDKNLSDYESTRRHAHTGEFLDTCSGCLGVIRNDSYLPTIDRTDLIEEYNEESSERLDE